MKVKHLLEQLHGFDPELEILTDTGPYCLWKPWLSFRKIEDGKKLPFMEENEFLIMSMR